MTIKVACFSDTHGFHNKIELPCCDIAIFAGDFSSNGSKWQTSDFLRWYSNQRQCVHKIMIPGNHDLSFDPKYNDYTKADEWLKHMLLEVTNEELIILNNSGVNLYGLNIWGSPVTPDFRPDTWAFNKSRGEDIKAVWDLIPQNTDILITHGPIKGKGDYIPNQGVHVGCEDLLNKVIEVKPKLLVCGHIHEGYGVYRLNRTTGIVNASICNEQYKPYNHPIIRSLKV